MAFWQKKQSSIRRSRALLVLFFLMTFTLALTIEIVLRRVFPDVYYHQIPFFFIGFVGIVLIVASFNFTRLYFQGGDCVAKMMKGELVTSDTENPEIKMLINIVEEMKIASHIKESLSIYLLPSDEINAFVAGLKEHKKVLAVTKGALQKLTRDELQAVIGHEMGHIVNHDVVINTQLGALIGGFTFIFITGLRLFRYSSLGRRRSNNGNKRGDIIVIGILLCVMAGAISWFCGKLIQAGVSRQREFLADASSVQFTRNPDALIGAFHKIQADTKRDMPIEGSPYSHLFFHRNMNIVQQLFASHPSMDKRIKALQEMAYQQ